MKKVMTGTALAALSLTVLMLLQRIGTLHDQIARIQRERSKEARPVAKTRESAPPVAVAPPELPAPSPAKTAPATPTPFAPTAGAPEEGSSLEKAVIDFDSAVQISGTLFNLGERLDEAGLSDYQRARIDEHRRLGEAARQELEARTEAAVRAEMSADQLQKYDEAKARGGAMLWLNGGDLLQSGAPVIRYRMRSNFSP